MHPLHPLIANDPDYKALVRKAKAYTIRDRMPVDKSGCLYIEERLAAALADATDYSGDDFSDPFCN